MSGGEQALVDFQESLNTCLSAKVISFNGKLASVKPTINKTLTSGDSLAPPVIHDVPVCLMLSAGNTAKITIPIKPGDDVLLVFAQRSTENWKLGLGDNQSMIRSFDISDAFAIPLLHPSKTEASTENIEIKLDSAEIIITSSAEIKIKASQCEVDAPTTFKQPVVMEQGFSVAGGSGNTATIKGNFEIEGNITQKGNLSVDGDIGSQGNINASGAVHGSNI